MMARHHTTPRLGRFDDIAKFVAFVASDDAGFISGSVHAVDGGVISVAPYAADMREFGRLASGGQGCPADSRRLLRPTRATNPIAVTPAAAQIAQATT
jgi:hypothetical protein